MRNVDYNIRKALPSDVGFILRTLHEAFTERLLIPTIYRASGAGRYLNYLISEPIPSKNISIIYFKNKKIGFCIYTMNNRALFLDLIGLCPKVQGSGHGKYILDYLLEICSENAVPYLSLNVFKSNKKALKWYLDLGFKQIKAISLYEVKNEVSINFSKFQFIDYPNYKLRADEFGFSELYIKTGNYKFIIGQIEESLFFKEGYNIIALGVLHYLKNLLKKNHCYFYSDKDLNAFNADYNIEFKDQLISLRKSINE